MMIPETLDERTKTVVRSIHQEAQHYVDIHGVAPKCICIGETERKALKVAQRAGAELTVTIRGKEVPIGIWKVV